MSEQNPTHKITVKFFLSLFVAMVAVSLIIGYVAAKYETQSFLRKNPQGSRVIQTIQTQTQAVASYVDVVNNEKGNVVGILNEKNNVTRNGVVLTADGIFVAPYNSNLKNSFSVITADGKLVNALLARAYPEKGVAFYRASGNFSAPQFPVSDQVMAGTEGIMIGISNNNTRIMVTPNIIQRASYEEALDDVVLREKQAKLVSEAAGEYLGAPLFDRQNNLLGIVVNTDKALLLPASEINTLLQDYLKHGAGMIVTLSDGLSGTWVNRPETDGKISSAFSVTSVARNSLFDKAGLNNNDLILGVNDKTFPTVQLWGAFLESARSIKVVTLDVMRGNQSLKIPVTITIQNATEQQ